MSPVKKNVAGLLSRKFFLLIQVHTGSESNFRTTQICNDFSNFNFTMTQGICISMYEGSKENGESMSFGEKANPRCFNFKRLG